MCVELALAIGLATFHPTTPDKDWNEQNNIVAVECDNFVVGHMINSYGLPTTFAGVNLYHSVGDFSVGITPVIQRGYPDFIPPVVAMTYVQFGNLRVSSVGIEAVNLSIVFDLGD